jgi:uncharacterized protein
MTEWVVIADSSPLIGLARIGQLDILRALAARVLMPPAVRDEVIVHSRDAPGAATVRQATWIQVEARAKKAGLIPAVKPFLDALTANGIYIDRALIEAVLKDLVNRRRRPAAPQL